MVTNVDRNHESPKIYLFTFFFSSVLTLPHFSLPLLPLSSFASALTHVDSIVSYSPFILALPFSHPSSPFISWKNWGKNTFMLPVLQQLDDAQMF